MTTERENDTPIVETLATNTWQSTPSDMVDKYDRLKMHGEILTTEAYQGLPRRTSKTRQNHKHPQVYLKTTQG